MSGWSIKPFFTAGVDQNENSVIKNFEKNESQRLPEGYSAGRKFRSFSNGNFNQRKFFPKFNSFQNLSDWNLSKPNDFENGHQMVTFNGHGLGQENLEFSPTYREESFQGLDSKNYTNIKIN